MAGQRSWFPGDEYDFFDRVPYRQASNLSRDAAKALRYGARRTTLEAKVYEALVSSGEEGLTDPEIQTKLQIDGSTQRPRRVKLCKRGLVRDSGQTRPSPKSRQCTVWVTTTIPPQE